jgi:hypothetical protein
MSFEEKTISVSLYTAFHAQSITIMTCLEVIFGLPAFTKHSEVHPVEIK